jgi:hypothetical protein
VISVKREGYNTNVLGFSTKGESDNAPSAMDIPLRKQGGPIVTQPEVQPKNSAPVEIVQPTDTTKTEKVSQLKGVVKTEIEKTPIEGVLVTFINECDGSKQQVVTGPTGYMLLIWKKVVTIPSKYQRTVMELRSIKLIRLLKKLDQKLFPKI